VEDRHLTFIMVPEGDLDTKTIQIPFKRVKLFLILAGLLFIVMVFMMGTWWLVAAQAARVPKLSQQLAELEKERAKVDSLAHVLAEVETQYQRVREMLGADAPAAGKQPLLPELPKGVIRDDNRDGVADNAAPDAWPLTERGFVTRGLTRTASAHPGIDIAVPQKTYVRASGPGVVRLAIENDTVYGNYLVIDHGGGLESLYAHASRLLVRKGASVKRLQLIALSGSTGQSTAPHLHFEVRKGGKPVDPYQYVRQP
jgi:murein DD-endopeptidase MepM/ murein hydrolase activator NlpD